MSRRDYIITNPLLRHMVVRCDVDYSSIFATHHILQLELHPGNFVPTINEVVEYEDLGIAFKAQLEEVTEGLKGKKLADKIKGETCKLMELIE